MASLIDPLCAVPTFLLKNQEEAERCGKLRGYVNVITIVICLVIFFLVVFFLWGKFTFMLKLKAHPMLFSIIGLIIVGILCIIPALRSWVTGRKWLGHHQQILSYMDHGLSNDAAVIKLQDLYQTQVQSGAVSQAGLNVSSAILANAFNKK